MDRIVTIGGGGHAKVLISILQKTDYRIVGYTDPQARDPILGIPCLGTDNCLPQIIKQYPLCKAAIGVGKLDTSTLRSTIQDNVEAHGFVVPPVVSPCAIVNNEVSLGAGTVVLDGAVVNSGVKTGKGCIINTNSTVEHDCQLGDNVHIAPGATLSGGVHLGHHCLIGTGANVIQAVHICDNCLIGAGSTVVRDVIVPGTYVGIPAKRIG